MLSKMKIVGVLLAIVVATSAMAGGNAASGGAAGTNAPKTNLRVINYTDLTVANAAAFEKWQWDTFLANNPDVTIDKEDLFDEPFHEKTAAYVASGNLPDVLFVWPAGRSTALHANKLLKDLAPFIQKDNLKSKYLPICIDPSEQGGGYLAMIPQALTATQVFYINMDVLNACGLQPAKTYAEMVSQVPILKAKGYETLIMPCKDTWVMQSCLFSAIAGRFCGEGWDKKILSGQTKFTDPDFVGALDFIRRIYADGVLNKSALGIDYGEGPGLFSTGKSAYYVDGDWRVGDFITDADTGVALISPDKQKNIGITIFPAIDGAKINNNNSTVLGTGWGMSAAIPAGSAKEDAAWRLVKWLCGSEVETRMLQNGGISAPSRTDVDPTKLNLEPMQISMVNLSSQYQVGTCVIDDKFESDVWNPINDGLVEIGLGSKTPAQVANDAQQALVTWQASK